MKRLTVVFRALANINRLKIIKMLSGGSRMIVGEIAEELKISFKATSNHLAILKNLDVLESHGVEGHVIYSLIRANGGIKYKLLTLFLHLIVF